MVTCLASAQPQDTVRKLNLDKTTKRRLKNHEKSLKLEKFLISGMDSHILRSTLFKKNFIKRFLSEQFGIQFDDKVFTFCKCLNSGPKERGFLCAIT